MCITWFLVTLAGAGSKYPLLDLSRVKLHRIWSSLPNSLRPSCNYKLQPVEGLNHAAAATLLYKLMNKIGELTVTDRQTRRYDRKEFFVDAYQPILCVISKTHVTFSKGYHIHIT